MQCHVDGISGREDANEAGKPGKSGRVAFIFASS